MAGVDHAAWFRRAFAAFETEGEANEHVLDMVEMYRLSAERAA